MIAPKDAAQAPWVNRVAAEAANETRKYKFEVKTVSTGDAYSLDKLDYDWKYDSDEKLYDSLADAIADADSRETGITCEAGRTGSIYHHIWIEVYKVIYDEDIKDYGLDWDTGDTDPVYVIGR